MSVKPFVLVILDGFGLREDTKDNAVAQAKMPHWDQLWKTYPHTTISGSGIDVGLPGTQMGNSEVGHTNLGAGRVVYQDLTRISKAIEDNEFASNAAIAGAIDAAKQSGGALHIMGLLSDGGVHSFDGHLLAMIAAAKAAGLTQVYVHAFLDGRDTAPKSALIYLAKLEGTGATVASVVGRYYAMDRDNRWERVEQAYDMLTQGKAEFTASTAQAAVEESYERGQTDEFVKPTMIGSTPHFIQDGDSLVFMNFRADRARELAHAFVDKDFDSFERGATPKIHFACLTQYQDNIDAPVAYPPKPLVNVLGEHLAKIGKRQLRMAETEKYAHVTFFFNGGVETPFEGEDRILVPSPKVATYDLKPEMHAPELTEKLVAAIESGKYHAIICNYANPDMVGHTGNMQAAVQAIEAIDVCVGKVSRAVLAAEGEMMITADHGNAELMRNQTTGEPHTAHTNLPVPLVYVGRLADVVVDNGVLSDVAPTMLTLMGVSVPPEMTGRVIFKPVS
jgi:2,3-bisphosphoglycerate-independent phosphoglycerate mutase